MTFSTFLRVIIPTLELGNTHTFEHPLALFLSFHIDVCERCMYLFTCVCMLISTIFLPDIHAIVQLCSFMVWNITLKQTIALVLTVTPSLFVSLSVSVFLSVCLSVSVSSSHSVSPSLSVYISYIVIQIFMDFHGVNARGDRLCFCWAVSGSAIMMHSLPISGHLTERTLTKRKCPWRPRVSLLLT